MFFSIVFHTGNMLNCSECVFLPKKYKISNTNVDLEKCISNEINNKTCSHLPRAGDLVVGG